MYGLLRSNIWLRYNYLNIWNLRVQKNQNAEKIAFKVFLMTFLAMCITNQKLSVKIFTEGNLQNIFMEHDLLNILMIFGIKEKLFWTNSVILAIATNIPLKLKTGFVV